MTNLRRTDSDDEDFKSLVKLLDADLAIRDGADHGFYSQFNKIDKIRHAVVCYENGQPIGCGAIKAFTDEAMEVKRMYVSPDGRNKGIATRLLTELETWAKEMGYLKCVLETGKRQPEAIALYEKNGYRRIANYGQYIGVENSVCFEKILEN
ncbi:GNAT family N-acetyltransferase [Dyadobacter sp. CY261]|uniref:GNAT family N-acetyltransferase n=1 Tax=Dyadobacter sp. CY261 TaxID=2907203 RepID=UPI001F2372AA|nr:GNAT family N-acetyltransferase [Dyadobacter sp. CY261]MCF0069870.1 GNAT family N-acetyltransferase [Dyadobacter sp. CY261]